MTTKAGLHFFDVSKLPVKCHTDDDEWVGILHTYISTPEEVLHGHALMTISLTRNRELEGNTRWPRL